MFTNTDKSLLDRAARILSEMASDLYKEHGINSWGATKDSRKAKDVYDRLDRDARDLRTLAGRLLNEAKRQAKATVQPELTETPANPPA